jgi:hypothetical protein
MKAKMMMLVTENGKNCFALPFPQMNPLRIAFSNLLDIN